MDNFEVIIGRTRTLRLSQGTARLLYRGILSLSAPGSRQGLPDTVRNYLERRRAMLGCQLTPVDLPALLVGDMDGHAQRSLANQVRRITEKAAHSDSIMLGLNPAVRIRFLAALIEVYCLICTNLPVDLTLPPPVGISLPLNEWRLIELERQRLRAESEEAAGLVREATIEHVALATPARQDEIVHRQISVFA